MRSKGRATATLSSLLSLTLLIRTQASTFPPRLPAFLPTLPQTPSLFPPLPRSPLLWLRPAPAVCRAVASGGQAGGRAADAPAAVPTGPALGAPNTQAPAAAPEPAAVVVGGGEAGPAAGAEPGQGGALELEALEIAPSAVECWRPTLDDVERISWGKPAKKKSTGSRGVPHRLNQEERMLYDMAKRKGFVETTGSGYRRVRRGAPLVNTYRNWCDARGVASVQLHKAGGSGEGGDEVVVDLSTLRIPDSFAHIAGLLASAVPEGCTVELLGSGNGLVPDEEDELEADGAEGGVAEGKDAIDGGMVGGEEGVLTAELRHAFETEPIHRLSMCCVSWVLPRAEAKTLAKRLGVLFGTAEPTGKGKSKGSQGAGGSGAPGVKPGKGRRHGGFGIGSKAKKGSYAAREGKPR